MKTTKDKLIGEEDRTSIIRMIRFTMKKVKLHHEAESLKKILYKYKERCGDKQDLENDLKYISTYVF